jgi:hypothetical protein
LAVDRPDDRVFAYFGAWLGSAQQRKAQDEEDLATCKESAFKRFRTDPSNHQVLNPKT